MAESAVHTPDDLSRIYAQRFHSKEAYRESVWKVLIDEYFFKLVPRNGALLDIGFGYGEFLRLIPAARKFGMDLNPDARRYVPEGAQFLHQDCSQPWPIPPGSLDRVFTSNFFEHLPDKAALGRTLDHAYEALTPGGKLIAMGPNIAFLYDKYWDFWDHHLPLSHLSLSEALKNRGFDPELVLPRFLPYTMEGRRPSPLWLIRAYLRLPLVWPIFGKQFLIVATKNPSDNSLPV